MILGQAPGKTHKGKTSRKSIFIRANSEIFSRLQLGQPTKTLVLISNPTQIHWNLCQSLTEQQYDLCMACCTEYHLTLGTAPRNLQQVQYGLYSQFTSIHCLENCADYYLDFSSL
jgi:hypothetical protein